MTRPLDQSIFLGIQTGVESGLCLAGPLKKQGYGSHLLPRRLEGTKNSQEKERVGQSVQRTVLFWLFPRALLHPGLWIRWDLCLSLKGNFS